MPEIAGIDATFDHVAHATPSIRSSLPVYRDLLGGRFIGGGENPRTGFRAIQLIYSGGGKVELIEAMEGSGFLDSFFRRSPDGGLHHVTYKVPDIEEALDAARRTGFEPFGVHLEEPMWQEFFLHPRATGGTLIQLAHSQFDESDRVASISVEEFLENPVRGWESDPRGSAGEN